MYRRQRVLQLTLLVALIAGSLAACGGEFDVGQDEAALGTIGPMGNQTTQTDGNYGDDDGIPGLTRDEYEGCCKDSGCDYSEGSSGEQRCRCVHGFPTPKQSWNAVRFNTCVLNEQQD